MVTEHSPHHPARNKINWILIGFLAIAAFFLFTEHRAHLFGVLPYLLLLACPLMHLFMHHGHGAGESNHQHHAKDPLDDTNPKRDKS